MTTTQVIRPTTIDLWATAAAQMSDEDRNNINFSCPDKLNILSDLLQVTEKSRQECIKKRWRYTRKSGETVIFVDLFGKIVKWIDLFKQVGDTAIQYDPVHAALPWAGVRFLLQIAINDSDKFSFVVESAASIGEIICRYAVFEDVYLQSPSPATDELQRALVKFYAAIMVYLSKVKSYFEQNSAMRRLKSGFLAKSDIESYFSAIATAQETVDRCSCMVEMQEKLNQRMDLKRLLECIDGPMERISADLESIKDGFESSKRTEILRWISPEPYIQHHEQAKREVLLGTGQWLLSDPVFQRWKKESVSSILWLHGIPGSGKSKLVSIVIEDAKKVFQNGQSPAPVFFYCSRNTAEPARSNPDAIVASIVRQLSSIQLGHPLLPPTVAAYKKQEMEGFTSGSLGIDESRALILQLAQHYPLITIVIDALDECHPERRADLLRTFESILQECSSLVKIFVSSRDDQDIVWHLQKYPNLELSSNKNTDDITTFVRKETEALIMQGKLLRLSKNKENLKKEIIEQVTKNADGMFRWASLQLQNLCSIRTDEAVRERLERLPPKLEELYLELYEELTKTSADADREVTINAFSWLLCAQRTLTSGEFLAALSTTPRRQFNQLTKEHILEMCSNMVVFDPTLDTFRFAHLSVREFLEKRPEYTRESTNALAAETCLLDVLSATDNPATRRFLSNYRQNSSNSTLSPDLRQYSTIYWAPHCQLAANQRTADALKDLLCYFLSNDSDPRSAVVVWASRIREQFNDYSIEWDLRKRLQDTEAHNSQSLFIACCFDLQEGVRAQTTSVKYPVNSQHQTALYVAVNYGSCEVISILLKQRGADVVITEEVVMAAAGNRWRGKEVMMVLLEQRGADMVITEEVVEAAAGNEESGKEVMMILLEQRGADMVITEEVVKAAVENYVNGEEVMIVLLEQRGADVVITEEVVKAAAGNEWSGKEVMMVLLEQRGADVVITEEVVKAAAGNEWSGEEVMMVLLEQRGADVVITEEVVKAAAGNEWSGEEVMMVLLEQRGADVVITEEVVMAAAGNRWRGKEVMMVLLEQRGADMVITEEVVEAAAGNEESGKEVMMILLEQRGADMVITEEVVKAAAGNYVNGKEVMTVLLEQRGADVVITEEVVKAAAGNERSGKEVMTVLLEQRGADVVITEEVVKAAATCGQEGVLKTIEKHYKIISSKDQWSVAQFYNAAKSGKEDTIQKLLAEGVEPDLKNPRHVSPLWVAATNGNLRVVQVLLGTKLVDVNSKSIAGRPPVFWAAARGHEDIVKLLLEAGADHSLEDIHGKTPLSMAKENGHDKIVKLLSGR
ncbi:hypothetical protein B0J14DRAFT_517196 [Halenospora varia]|nr:hypothetical protein B0J14DRAFT_517196 [Halenospora varia]